jgi:hypothetical protein
MTCPADPVAKSAAPTLLRRRDAHNLDGVADHAEELETDRAKSAAAELGARGGKARTAKMTPARRAEIAKKAAASWWKR